MSIVDQGQIKGSFSGFGSAGTTFELTSGRKWCQIESKYFSYYSHMPHAKVVQEGGGYRLYVDGVSDSVAVRPA
jgi:hypothetical protein